MTDALLAAFRAADRLPPAAQDELATRILADVAPDLVHSRAWRHDDVSISATRADATALQIASS